METFVGKTAFVTGGASGIGLALARAFLAEGMNVMLADIEEPALTAALVSLSNHGPRVRGTVCDVSRRETLERAAADAMAAFGKVHVLCNNAGVSRAGFAERFGGAFALADDTENAARNARFLAAAEAGLDPDQVAPLVLRAIRENRLYVFTHLDRKDAVAARFARILDDFAPLQPPDGEAP